MSFFRVISSARVVSKRDARRFLAPLLLVAATFCAWTSVAHAEPALTFKSFSAGAFNADGTPSTQAGAHPSELVTSFVFGTVFSSSQGTDVPAAAIKDTLVDIPAGVIGDPGAVPQCREQDLHPADRCPADTQVGYADVDRTFVFRGISRVAVSNVVPTAGESAAFRFVIVNSSVRIGVKVRSDGDYGVTATARNANAGAPIYGVTLHLWGVPADPSHDADRIGLLGSQPGPSGLPRKPFLRNPTSCTGPTTTAIHATSWAEPETWVTALSEAPATTGCAAVAFAPTLTLTPDSKTAGVPAGLGINLNLPQNENPDGLATADLKRAVITLPAGVTINPGAADGLDACSDAQFGLHSSDPDNCPGASNIGTTKVTTPLLPKPLEGSAYLAAPLEQGPAAAAAGRMFRIFLELHGSGVQVKLSGTVVPDPVTGQLVATFDNNPQLPFSNFHMDFIGGSRAPLSLPRACGTYTTHSEFTSWASNTPVGSDSAFTIDQACDRAGRFEPSLEAGTFGSLAGSSSPFAMTLSRPDGQQDLSSLALTLPPGLVANIANIPLCPAEQAAAGTCSSASQIGKVITAAGAGTNPLYVPQAGKTPSAVYLSGPYKGAPFSLSVVVPAQAGPFDLGTVVVRAALFIDKNDAHVSVISDPLPTILDGVPLNVQKIAVTVDRPGTMVLPTNCTATQVSGVVGSSAGSTANVSSPYQASSCASLKFAPKFSVSTVGASSKANGASLTAKLFFPSNQGTQANITKVKVELPKQLPSRLTTLQKACTSAQFDANPAGCPPASFIGHATVHTPLLPVPLTGPAIFVSHGGEAFPSLVMVLQGYGVTVNLVGMTFISKAGVTSTTFKTVPDVPFSDFELTLPQGPYSALAANLPKKANYSFCAQKMTMPSEFIAQNGAILKQSTPVTPTGCGKAKATRAQKLALALKACKHKAKGRRAGCARVARRQFVVVAKRARGRG
jgi:hypothetical protein